MTVSRRARIPLAILRSLRTRAMRSTRITRMMVGLMGNTCIQRKHTVKEDSPRFKGLTALLSAHRLSITLATFPQLRLRNIAYAKMQKWNRRITSKFILNTTVPHAPTFKCISSIKCSLNHIILHTQLCALASSIKELHIFIF